MRLICPNCDAEYEVDDAAIPLTGRDVQCSNCGHAWFQTHPEVEAEQEAEEALYEPPVAAVTTAAEPVAAADEAAVEPEPAEAAEPAEEAAMAAAPEAEAPAWPTSPEAAVAATLSAAKRAEPAAAASAPRRGLDESVLAVLREEAEREKAARAAEVPGLETQVDMDLEEDEPATAGGMAAAVRRIARLKGEPEEPEAPKARRDMLPAIDEINSTLRATGDRRSEAEQVIIETMDDPVRPRPGFGRGFMTLVILALVVVVLYLVAPLIGDRVPGLKPYAEAYVQVVDQVRIWLDVKIKALVATLRGYEAGQGG